MDELDDAVGEVSREIRTVVGRAIFAQPAGDEDLGKAIGESRFDVRIGLVIA